MRFLSVIGLATMLLCGCATGVESYKEYSMDAVPATASATRSRLKVTFVGVATLLFDDGETAIMTDGFFSRPGYMALAGKIKPDENMINRTLQRLEVKSLAAVIPVHSHYDHAMDSPIVAGKTGALLAGSESSANIGRGYGFPEKRIKVVANGETVQFGRFKVTFLNSEHFPINFALGKINEPVSLPANVTDFKLGECYSLLIEHDGKTMLVQGSAGFLRGALNGRKADVVFLGVGGLGNVNSSYQEDYWREVVASVRPKRVIPIHWDNFYKSLDEPLQPQADFDSAMRFLIKRSREEHVDLRLPVAWVAIDPFAGL